MRKLFIFLAVIVLVLVLAGAASATGPATPAYTPAVSTNHLQLTATKWYTKKNLLQLTEISMLLIYPLEIPKLCQPAVKMKETLIFQVIMWFGKNGGSSGHSQIWWKDISKTNPAAIVHASPGKDQNIPVSPGTM